MAPDPNQRIEACAQAWHVEYRDIIHTSTSVLAYGTRHDQPVILKVIRNPGDEWNAGAVAAAFQGHGVVRVLAHQPGAALLEQLHPATSLSELVFNHEDDRACTIISDVITQLHEVQPERVAAPTAEQWGTAFDRYVASGDTQVDASLVAEARHMYAQLCSTQHQPRLLHGDLQHYNILYDERRGWTAIDPKGVIAELEFEFGAALRNPHGMPLLYNDAQTVEQRISLMTRGIAVDVQRVRDWAFAQAVLSLIWTTEDAGTVRDDEPALLLARALRL